MLRKVVRLVLSALLLVVLGVVVGRWRHILGASTSREQATRGRTETGVNLMPEVESTVPTDFTRLLLSWFALLLLGGAQFAVSFVPMGRSLRPLVMIPGVIMVAVVAISFMEVGKGPSIVRGFAVAAMFWLIVLLGLGSMDPLTRIDYLVPHAHVD